MRKWLMRLAAAASCLLAGAAFAGAVFLARPGLLLTGRAAGAALKRLGADYSPRWSSLRLSAVALERRRHRYVLSAADFCVADRGGVFSGCFSELELSAVVLYSWTGPVVERVERLVAVSPGARIDLRRRKRDGSHRGLPASLLSTPVQALRVELGSLTVVSHKTSGSGAFRAVLAPGDRRPLSVSSDFLVDGPHGARRLKTELAADTDMLKGGNPSFLDVIARVDLGSRDKARAALRVRRESLGYVGSGSAEVESSAGPLRMIRLSACEGSGTRAAGAELSCRYTLLPAKRAAERFKGLKEVTGGVWLSGRLDGERFQGALEADVDPIAGWYKLSGDLALRVSGRLGEGLDGHALGHELRAAAEAARFEDVVALLRGTKYSIPAPIHVLKGPLRLALDSRGDPRAKRQTVRYRFFSDLAGPRQRLIARAAGEVSAVNATTPDRSFEHEGELILKEAALELPHLDIGHVPDVIIDQRIQGGGREAPWPPAGYARSAPSEGRTLPLRGRLVVKTEKPMLLFSNLAKDPLPVALDLVATYPPPKASGTVSVGKFDVELFRRSATLEHLNVALSSGSRVGALEGLVRYQTPVASVDIVILGTTAKPRIELASVPPMKRDEIIALLIFGKRPGDLGIEEGESVRNTGTALESRAFGLTSLYLLGATPIERVGYDSATKTASVKLRLPGGAHLQLGSDFYQSRELRLRKPIAAHWAIQSEVTDHGERTRAATTFLEWFNRY